MSTEHHPPAANNQADNALPGSSTIAAHIQQPSESVGSIAADRVEKKKTKRGGGGSHKGEHRSLTSALKKMEKKVESLEKKLEKMQAQNTRLKEDNKVLKATNSRILRIPKPSTA